jgi:hypothetical protein
MNEGLTSEQLRARYPELVDVFAQKPKLEIFVGPDDLYWKRDGDLWYPKGFAR